MITCHIKSVSFNGPDQLKHNLCLEKSTSYNTTSKIPPSRTCCICTSRNNVLHNRFLSRIENSLHESVMALLGDCERIKALCVRKHGTFSFIITCYPVIGIGFVILSRFCVVEYV